MSTEEFWNVAKPMIDVTEKHPFLVAMVDGTLKEENFKYYVVQDTLYLKEFADCLTRLSKSASTPEDAKQLEHFAHDAEHAELDLHNSFFKEWNISAEGATEMPNCLLYTSYMKRIVATKSHAHGLATLLPCFWVYMHVGKCMLKLREELGDSVKRPPQFDAWIDMYGGEEFEKEVTTYIAMVEAAIKKADEKTVKEMQDCFLMCCKLEHMFWDQADTLLKWPDLGGL
uniref:Thiaminase-2/PQQC domain-containing protein n=1 Tax=Craspedostauros australis TaxID=1486917 RepID=A0A7R9WUR9_9STRA|mmetsp:Transcript_18526/g.51514  ORF Transcript_18526/g.51514 Transcript_18526/m.51514 type:complete len:228 (+) Transcript_18526:94-777(+)|eukprot:CAMPEP_0198130744 /NCGR_PEP_ID=MMETSP1442-20131203/54606_1 /TAXON_ID= /ORGANISM="Craspedostauros australis, Strain CCMP3328" /LENGTH=227 /DNA_ID=CAMNT_0043791423 /DNA_START=79 /DNA_END=762 /DNA_ORIENTATION=+